MTGVAAFDAAVDRACRPRAQSRARRRRVPAVERGRPQPALARGRRRAGTRPRRRRSPGRAVLGRDGRRVGRSPTASSSRCSPRVRPVEYADVEFRHGLHAPDHELVPVGARDRRVLRGDAARRRARLVRGGAAVAATRVYVRLHHASDVLAGAGLGLALGARAPSIGADAGNDRECWARLPATNAQSSPRPPREDPWPASSQ